MHILWRNGFRNASKTALHEFLPLLLLGVLANLFGKLYILFAQNPQPAGNITCFSLVTGDMDACD